MRFAFLFLVAWATWQTSAPVANGEEPTQLDAAGVEYFETHVRPLLVRRCYECHSSRSDPVEGGLRLDSRAAWQRGGDSGAAILPGKPADSRLLKAVLYQDPTLAMPPDNALSKQEIEVPAGRRFWSFQPIRDPQPPAVGDDSWVQRPVDRFVLARLEARGLRPVDRAARQTLIRRASLDVLGLPPTPAEVASFVGDETADAWPRLIERLLASPH